MQILRYSMSERNYRMIIVYHIVIFRFFIQGLFSSCTISGDTVRIPNRQCAAFALTQVKNHYAQLPQPPDPFSSANVPAADQSCTSFFAFLYKQKG